MADVTLDVGGIFPAGTKVEAVPRIAGVLQGPGTHAKGKVEKDTTVTLTGLVDNGPYFLVGEVDGTERKVSFDAHDAETRSLPPDEAVTQAATRRVAEKVADGAAAVRADNPALAPDPDGAAEREQSEAHQAERDASKHGDRVSGPLPKDLTESYEQPAGDGPVVGARSVAESRPRPKRAAKPKPKAAANRSSSRKAKPKK